MNRPRPPKPFLDKWNPYDFTLSRTNVKLESFSCDSFKVILEMCNQLCDMDKLQNEDIYAILEVELANAIKSTTLKFKPRPKPSKKFLDNWTSDNYHTQTKIETEYLAKGSINVIIQMCLQIIECDGLSAENVLSVIWSDLQRHIIWHDINN